MTINWPAELVPQGCIMTLRNASASGGRALSGRQQRVYHDAGFWQIRYSGIVIKDRATAGAYRAVVARLRQGENINAAVFDRYPPIGTTHSGNSVRLAGSHALRATTIDLTSTGIAIEVGQFFSIAHRTHQITEITSGPASPPLRNQLVLSSTPWSDEWPWSDDVTASAGYTVKITPPLRSAHGNNTVCDFGSPTLRAALGDMSDADDLALDLAGTATSSLTLYEQVP